MFRNFVTYENMALNVVYYSYWADCTLIKNISGDCSFEIKLDDIVKGLKCLKILDNVMLDYSVWRKHY